MYSVKITTVAIIIQLVIAGLAFVLNAFVFVRFGSKLYYSVGLISGILLAANYFEFGVIAKIRYLAAMTTEGDVLGLSDEFISLAKKIFISMLSVAIIYFAIVYFYSNADSDFQVVGPVAAISPFVILINAVRGFYEGRGDVIKAALIRGINGLLPPISIVLSLYINGSLKSAWFILFFGFVSIIIAHNNLFRLKSSVAFKAQDANYNINNNKLLIRIGLTESIITVCGVFFLYADRFLLSVVDVSKSEAGVYVFLLEIYLRYSLIYVPLAAGVYKKIAKVINRRQNYVFKRVLVISSQIKYKMFWMSVLFVPFVVGWFGYVNKSESISKIILISLLLSIGVSFQAGNYLMQRFLSFTRYEFKTIVVGYAVVMLFYITLFFVLSNCFSIVGVAGAFCMRAIVENLMYKKYFS